MYEVHEVLNEPGFYTCEEFKEIIVSKLGVFKNKETGIPIELKYSKSFYPTLTYPGQGTVLVHRILAFMFIEKPIDFEGTEYVVNHKDGNKSNFDLDNLEWVTSSDNAFHAYREGLRKDNTPILVKDLRSEKIKRFYSLQEYARCFGVNGFNVHWNLLPRNRGKVSFNYFIVIREGDVWPDVNASSLGKHRNGSPKPMVVKNLDDNSIIIYDSAGSAARAINMSPAALRQRMVRNSEVIIDGLLYGYLDDPELLEKHEVLSLGRKTNPPNRIPIPIEVLNIETNEKSFYESTDEFARNIGVLKNTIQKSVLVNSGRWGKYFITYVRPPKE